MAIGHGDGLGRLAAGCLADVVLIDVRVPHLTPLNDPLAALVYAARGAYVHTVLVSGRIVVRDHEITVLDEERIRARVTERALRARSVAGV